MNRSADGWCIEETSRESEEALDQNELRYEMFSRRPEPGQATRPSDDSMKDSGKGNNLQPNKHCWNEFRMWKGSEHEK